MAATDKPVCAKCGKIHLTWQGHPACAGHQSGDPTQPCQKNPLRGMRVCRTHGGALPAAVKARDERLALLDAQGEIAQLMRECDIPEQHPIDGLLSVVRVSGSMMRLLTIKVGELAEDPVAGDDAFWGLDKDGQMVPNVYVKLLRIWSERHERACKTALEAGVEERRIRLAEDTADTVFSALSKAIAVAGLDSKTQAALTQAMAKELRTSSN